MGSSCGRTVFSTGSIQKLDRGPELTLVINPVIGKKKRSVFGQRSTVGLPGILLLLHGGEHLP
jgi:hypothetical protein